MRARRLFVAAAAVTVLAGCSSEPLLPTAQETPVAHAQQRAATAAPVAPVVLETAGGRASRGTVAAGGGDSHYNYAPAVMQDGGAVRLWWCSQLGSAGPPGDDILYASAPTLDGPFRSPRAVFTGSRRGFDAVHTCDPSVLRIDGTYYLYYTGSAGGHAHGNAIGLAVSTDGRHWQRRVKPIATASGLDPKANKYGIGQPAALKLGAWFYLMYTDTTEPGAGPNGAGQFVLRAHDAAFTKDVQTLTANGFQARDAHPVKKSIVDAFSADWMWVDALNAFAVAHETKSGTTITFLGADLTAAPYEPVVLTGPWQEGPGLARTADGHAVIPVDDPCGRVPLDVLRATVNPAAPTNMVHFGLDVTGADGCGTVERALNTLRGYAFPSPQRTMDLVVGSGVVRVDRRSVAAKLAVAVLDHPVPALAGVPVLARLKPGAPARTAPGRGVGLLLDDGKLWTVPAAAAALNASATATVTPEEFDGYAGGTLSFR
ncbi:beta-xylosidase [Labedaea rhizosphaerae]|uniref:Beta-xylosidase n=1 Tax=Labedaea rhizosphaerae TaxID=598644 RepID=A0A4R6SJL7_LABRH|nr:beta-xylosidase [Labedaea rhizosphaerae]TDQ01198.1 hypothetical protein EV186_1021066 [Labedaea rhizosphaerae]